jgi:hypothetical protein
MSRHYLTCVQADAGIEISPDPRDQQAIVLVTNAFSRHYVAFIALRVNCPPQAPGTAELLVVVTPAMSVINVNERFSIFVRLAVVEGRTTPPAFPVLKLNQTLPVPIGVTRMIVSKPVRAVLSCSLLQAATRFRTAVLYLGNTYLFRWASAGTLTQNIAASSP